jgi:hypothetical protein
MTLTLIDGGPGCMRDDCMVTITYQTRTLAYYPHVHNKDGINMNPDRNQTTEEVRCLSCGKKWKREHYGTKTNP